MEKIKIDLDRFKKKPEKVLSERGELIEKFLEKMNVGRNNQEIVWNGKKIKLRPYTASGMNNKLRHVETEALYSFLKECEAASNFQTYFNWKFKVAKESKNVCT